MQALAETGQTLTFERTVRADPKEVFWAFTTSGALRNWFCDSAQVDARKGGLIYLTWNDGYYSSGEFTEFVPGESLAYTWRGPGDTTPSIVNISLSQDTAADDGNSHTTVRVSHSGIITPHENGSGESLSSANGFGPTTASELEEGWQSSLENLQSLLETGEDLRITRRPLFGLNSGDNLNDELAARLGVPVKEGIWLGGLIEGMGPHAAGLQKDDVVVQIGDRPVVNFPGFSAALQMHKAGDEVPVTFYRGPQEHTVTVKLSARPKTEYPADTTALAKASRDSYASLDAELDGILEGVTDEASERRPTENDWNAKEVIAHLIAVERDIHTYITAMIEGADIEQIFHSNTIDRLKATAGVYPTLAELVLEFKRSEAITAEMVATLPDAIANRKSQYSQIATHMSTFADHHREHFVEIKRLVGK